MGILADEKRGSLVYYRLRVPCVLNFFKCVRSGAEQRLRQIDALADFFARRFSGLAK